MTAVMINFQAGVVTCTQVILWIPGWVLTARSSALSPQFRHIKLDRIQCLCNILSQRDRVLILKDTEIWVAALKVGVASKLVRLLLFIEFAIDLLSLP